MKKTVDPWKYEKFLFALFIVLTALPVLCSPFFPTVDGPAHLHNGNLLKHLLFLGNDFGRAFFDINKQLNSNFLDHIWFAFFGLFLPASLVEKSILLTYIISLPFSFRYLVKKLVNDERSAKLSSYLIFPFVYSFTFRIGFFNFCLGIPVLFWILGYWTANREQPGRKKIIVLAALSTLLYISHIFNFMLWGIILFVNELQYVVHARTLKGVLKKLVPAIWILIPGLLLSLIFFISNSGYHHEAPVYLPADRLFWTIIDLSPIITLSYEREFAYAQIISYALLVLVLLVIIDYFRKRKTPTSFRPLWIFPATVVLLLFFIFPDWIASGGFISIRWALYFFLVLIVLIAAKALPARQLAIPVAVILVTHLFFIHYHNEQTKLLSADAEILTEAENFMDENSVLLPLNYSDNWIQINHAGYMSTHRNIINLDNYEPTKPHFPLIWKKGEQVYELMPGYGNRMPPCINIDAYEKATKHRIDYLSRFAYEGKTIDSCVTNVEKEIDQRFEPVYQSANKKLQLYKRKPGT